MPMPYDELGTHGGKGKLYPPERGGGGWSIGSPDRFTSGAFRSSQCTAMLCAAGLTLPPPPSPAHAHAAEVLRDSIPYKPVPYGK